MSPASRAPEEHDGVFLTLDGFIQVLSIAKDACGIPPAQAAFGAASALLTTIRDTMANHQDYVELGRSCVDVCQVLNRGLNGKRLDKLPQSVLDAIEQFTRAMAVMRNKIIKQGKRNAISRFLYAKVDKDQIAAWKQDLLRILHIFNTELVLNTLVMVADLHQDRDGAPRQQLSNPARSEITSTTESVALLVHSASIGELPPPAPKSCFGRDELIEEVIGLAENFKPIALIGAGGIGKTSIALSVLHHTRIKARFGGNRRFIRCDQFPASRAHFLARLSKVIGAGVENPEDLAPLRPLLSSGEMLIVLDNTESILDPQGTDAREIYAIVNELCQFESVCVCITSRITTVPQYCAHPEIPTLSMEAANSIFYGIYGNRGGRSTIIDNLLQRLDFHALSVTLLATTASHNGWTHGRLADEWEKHRAQVLRTDYNESLAATMELSLNSPTFRKLGPAARDLLEVIAFFPQGVDEKNLNWFFPTIPDRKTIFDKFNVLSLTYRNNDFITMLAPIRDYLCPQNPKSTPLLSSTKDHYFARLSVVLDPTKPEFEKAQWIRSEDVNVEHLLDVFTSIDENSGDVWNACIHFLDHLCRHKPRVTVLMQRIESLPDGHHSKSQCLVKLAGIFNAIGGHAERKRLLTHALKLRRQQGDNFGVAQTLADLSDANRRLYLYEEGIQQGKEASEIFKRFGNTTNQAICWKDLALLFYDDGQLDAAEDAISRAINLIPEGGQEHLACESHCVLGNIHRSRGERERAIHNFEKALRIASPFNLHDYLFWNHWSMAILFCDQSEFNEANAHIEQATLHAAHNEYNLGRATETRARVWHLQHRLEDAKSEALCALKFYEKLGAVTDIERCSGLLQSWNEQ